ncbi:hypothetical protein [Aequorivita xiaoshiensis]|uniref:Uncharacterized protein n=1 Tax=Aequorivita xiaoshiensis TaxID=2874476 RepID=A0A9X1R073_9FLAO|nr:hypothetical protein [Aequorivita xiaoshiensis]MCG2431931.1 hypothetical protein [Aequorivita xiaoshiensis]
MENKNNTLENGPEFLDSDQMPFVFSSLIINVASVNKKFGTLIDFISKFDLNGQTNGKLLIVAEIVTPPGNLIQIVENRLRPLNFVNKLDYVFVDEELIRGAGGSYTPYLNQPHLACKNIPWLGSLITADGNFVWYKETVEKEIEAYNFPFVKFNVWKQIGVQKAEKSVLRSAKMNHMPISESRVEYIKKLSKLDDLGLIELFNTYVGRKHFSIRMQMDVWLLQDEFIKRNLDYSVIFDGKSFSFAKKIKLEGKKVITI